jgi:formate hydrogenlyase subunit 6/NADH:ubiquinone oxidoreductase subunit I
MNLGLVPRLHVERCTRYRYSYSACRRCVEACPHGALEVSGEGVSLVAGSCRHCGLCLSACPTEAFESKAVAAGALLRAAAEAKRWTIACSPSGVPGDTTLPCIGALDAGTAASLLSRGVQLHLTGLGHCEACAHGAKAAAAIGALVAGVDHLRGEVGGTGWGELTLTDEKGRGVDRLGAGRRQFFRRLVAGGVAPLMAEEEARAVPQKAVRAAAHHRPSAGRLIAGLAGDQTLLAHPALAVGAVTSAAGTCTGCELCERVCPTGALWASASDGRWQLEFNGQCVSCGVCVEACQPGALALSDAIPVAHEGVVLHTLSRTRCRGCGRIHVGNGAEATCPVCADDEMNFAAIFG